MEIRKGSQEVFRNGNTKRSEVLRAVKNRWREMVSNQKSDKPSKELGPLDFRRRWYVVKLSVHKSYVETFMVEKL